jgi:peptide/nickel transport system permease protein
MTELTGDAAVGLREVERPVEIKPLRVPLRQPTAVFGMVIVLTLIVCAIFAPWIAPHDPLQTTGDLYAHPSWKHIFGTDELGRDLFSRVIYGARTSFPIALAVVACSLAIGGVLGAVAGYVGGFVDTAIMRFVELFFAFPRIILAMAVAAAFGPSVRNSIIALVIVSWPVFARVVRGAVLSCVHEDFVSSAITLGRSPSRVLAVDVLPNVVGPVVVLATLDLGSAILLLASLSYLGLGIRPPTPEWGSTVADGSLDFLRWWVGTFAGLAIMLAVLGFNLLGDGLRDILDPRTSRSGAL